MDETNSARGFPLPTRERGALDQLLADGQQSRPHGAGYVSIFNLVGRGWIAETVESGRKLYTITELGRIAVEIDKIIVSRDKKKRAVHARGPATADFTNLRETLARLRDAK